MTYIYTALVLAVVAALVVGYVRMCTGGGYSTLLLVRIGTWSSYTSSASVALLVAAFTYHTFADAQLSLSPDGWLVHALIGVLTPLIGFVHLQVIFLLLGGALAGWACRKPKDPAESTVVVLRNSLSTLLGATAVGVLLMTVVYWAARIDAGLLVVPLCFAAMPLVPTLIVPWLKFAKARHLQANDALMEKWLADLRHRPRTPRFRIRVQDGEEANAYALRGLGGHLVVIGGGLANGLSSREMQAVLAHEVAHVIHRDVPVRLVPLAMGGAFFVALCITYLAGPLFATDHPLGLAAGGVTVSLAALVFNILIPGYFMKKMELRADRLAVELLGDPAPMEDALRKLAALNDEPLEAKSWSHPSYLQRIDAIRSLPGAQSHAATP